MAIDFSASMKRPSLSILVILAFAFLLQVTSGQKSLDLKLTIPSAGNADTVPVSESLTTGSTLGFVEVSKYKDGSAVSQVECHTDSEHIVLDQVVPGAFSLKVGDPLDREQTPTLQVLISCSDQEFPPATATVTCNFVVSDVNDNAPEFRPDSLRASVTEGMPLDISILRVVADDVDSAQNGVVMYSMVKNNDSEGKQHSDYFKIDPATGDITVSAEIDREEISEFTFEVLATDKGEPPLSSTGLVSISVQDLNDNKPVLSPVDLHVKENQKAETFVGTLSAFDPDEGVNGEVTFSINLDGYEDLDLEDFLELTTSSPDVEFPNNVFPFTLTEDGHLYTTLTFDREVRDRYEAEIVVMDKGRPQMTSSSFLTVIIDDVNERPFFESACLPEYSIDGDADDADTDYEAVLQSDDANFTLEDDNSSSSSMAIVDWSNPDPDKIIYQVEAGDPDLGQNGELMFSIVPGSSDGQQQGEENSVFGIDAKTGEIFLLRHFRKTDSLRQMVNVSVSDMGSPALSVYCGISVTFDLNISNLAPVTSSDGGRGGGGGGGETDSAGSLQATLIQTVLCALLFTGLVERLQIARML